MSNGTPEPFEDRARPLGFLTTVAIVYVFLWGCLAVASLLFDLHGVSGSNWVYLSLLFLLAAVFRIAKAERR